MTFFTGAAELLFPTLHERLRDPEQPDVWFKMNFDSGGSMRVNCRTGETDGALPEDYSTGEAVSIRLRGPQMVSRLFILGMMRGGLPDEVVWDELRIENEKIIADMARVLN